MAQAQPNFSSLLDAPSSSIERPKPYPIGTYLGVVNGLPRIDKSSKKQTEFSEYTLNFLQAMDDVDPEALEEVGGIAGKSIKNTYYHTEAAVWRLKEFLDHLGAGDDSMTLRQRMQEVNGLQCYFTIRHEASEDGTMIFARVGSTAAAE